MIPSTPTSLDRRRPLHHGLRVGPRSPAIAGRKNKFVLAARLRPSFASQRSRNEATLLDASRQREAKRRKAHHPLAAHRSRQMCACAPLICRRGSGRCGARSPSGASRRRLSQRANAATQPRPCFARPRGRRRYPRRQSRLSQAPGAPVIMPAGTMPKPPGSGVTSPARRNRTRPIHRLSPVDVPEVSEIRHALYLNGDVCQWKGDLSVSQTESDPRWREFDDRFRCNRRWELRLITSADYALLIRPTGYS